MSLENMPVMRGIKLKAIPMTLLEPHERQARRNHGQSLQRLAERGGMSPTEILWLVRGLRWGSTRTQPDDEEQLVKWVNDATTLPNPA